jgi:hypothetical protein
MVVVKTAQGLTTRVRFLPVILTSLGSKSGTPFYLKHRNRVNAILTHILRRPTPAGSDVVRRLHSAMRQRARAVVRSRSGTDPHPLSPIAKKLRLVKIATVSAAVWGEAERTDELLE